VFGGLSRMTVKRGRWTDVQSGPPEKALVKGRFCRLDLRAGGVAAASSPVSCEPRP
jgi:hypothetical protein